MGHPEIYRELLRFYEVRNIGGTLALRRAQRLWELTRDSHDKVVWGVVQRSYEPRERLRGRPEWHPNTEFLLAVWRDAGERNLDFAQKLVDTYVAGDGESKAADILMEVINAHGPSTTTVSRCIELLDAAKRHAEADKLIAAMKPALGGEAEFLEAWAKHLLRTEGSEVDEELLEPRNVEVLTSVSPETAARLYMRAGMAEQAETLADAILRKVSRDPPSSSRELYEVAELLGTLGRWEKFEEAVAPRLRYSHTRPMIDELRSRFRMRPRGE